MKQLPSRFLTILSVLLALTFASAASAQDCLPIPIDDVTWQIHSDTGPMVFQIEAYETSPGEFILFTFRGDSIVSISTATDLGHGNYEVKNGDSGLTTQWQWQCGDGETGGHYLKIGGTHHHREFHPVSDAG